MSVALHVRARQKCSAALPHLIGCKRTRELMIPHQVGPQHETIMVVIEDQYWQSVGQAPQNLHCMVWPSNAHTVCNELLKGSCALLVLTEAHHSRNGMVVAVAASARQNRE